MDKLSLLFTTLMKKTGAKLNLVTRPGRWDELGDWDWHIYTIDTMYKIDNQWEPTV